MIGSNDMELLAAAKAKKSLGRWQVFGIFAGIMVFFFGIATELLAVVILGGLSVLGTILTVDTVYRRRKRRFWEELNRRGE